MLIDASCGISLALHALPIDEIDQVLRPKTDPVANHDVGKLARSPEPVHALDGRAKEMRSSFFVSEVNTLGTYRTTHGSNMRTGNCFVNCRRLDPIKSGFP